MTDNAGQITYWNEVAGPKWVAGQQRLDRLMAPLTRELLAAAAVRPGDSVLDIGCGCGELALRLAEAAGPDGRVLAVDVSGPMLAHARTRGAVLAGAAPIEWRLADAMVHPFGGDRDLAVSRFGVMFFDDRARAFANLRRSLKAGGRVAFLTWRRRSEVEWMQAPINWLASIVPALPSLDSEPGPFALGDGEATCAVLAAAGFHAVARRPVDLALTIGATLDEATSLLMDTGPAAGLVRDGPPELRVRAEAVLRDHLRPLQGADGVRMGAACWIYTASASPMKASQPQAPITPR